MPSWWPFRRSKAASQSGGSMASLLTAHHGRMVRRNQAELLAAYVGHPWLRQVVNRISYAVASTPWEAYKASPRARRSLAMPRTGSTAKMAAATKRALLKAGDLEPLETHPMLDVIERGNDAFSGVALRQITTMQIDLAGEAFWLPDMDGGGRVTKLWPLVPSWVREVPAWLDPKGAYKVRLPGSGVETSFPAELVTWLKDPSPLDPYGRGVGFAGALDDEIDADANAASHIRAFFVNGAIPPLIAMFEGLQPEQVALVEERWLAKTQGSARRRAPLFVPNKFEIKELAASFDDMQLVELREFLKAAIREVYGVPPEILGDVNDSKRATIDAADYLCARYVIVPRLDRLRFAYQCLADRSGEAVLIDYVSPVAEDAEFQLATMKAAPNAFRVDEWRAMAGVEPIGGEEGEAFYAPTKAAAKTASDADAEEPDAEADPTEDVDEAAKAAEVIDLARERAARAIDAVLDSLDAAPIRRATGDPALTRKITARTRAELRAIADPSEASVARVFDHAIRSRAPGIARREGKPEIKRALRAAFAEQKATALAALACATAPQAAAS